MTFGSCPRIEYCCTYRLFFKLISFLQLYFIFPFSSNSMTCHKNCGASTTENFHSFQPNNLYRYDTMCICITYFVYHLCEVYLKKILLILFTIYGNGRFSIEIKLNESRFSCKNSLSKL